MKKFYKWFTSTGGVIQTHDFDLVCSRFENEPKTLQESSFKNRAEQIKARFNHQFKGFF